ncbi:peptidylprolyl isomerase [Spirosoma lituiforme]
MKRCFLYLMLLIWNASHAVYGQMLPESTNKRHYTDLTASQEITRLYRKLKSGYAFDKLAQEYSQDYGSYTVGGLLGWQKPDQFVTAFSQVIGGLSKDQVSKPFKTEFGYHIVQLLDQKPGEVLTRHILLKVDR